MKKSSVALVDPILQKSESGRPVAHERIHTCKYSSSLSPSQNKVRSAWSWNNISSDINRFSCVLYWKFSHLGVHEDHLEVWLRCRPWRFWPWKSGPGLWHQNFWRAPSLKWFRGPPIKTLWCWCNNQIIRSLIEKQQQSSESTTTSLLKQASLSSPTTSNFMGLFHFLKVFRESSCFYHHHLGIPKRIHHLKRKNANVKNESLNLVLKSFT